MGVTVKDGAVPEHVLDFKVAAELVGCKSGINHVNALDSHVAGRQRGCLSGDDLIELTGSLKGTKSLDEQVFAFESVNGEGHGHGDDQRHAFGNADNEQSNGGGGEVNGTSDGRALDEPVIAAHDEEEPDNTEENERDGGDRVSIVAHNLRQDLKLVLEDGHFFLNLKGILVTVQVRTDLLLFESVLTDSENEGLASASHDNGVLEEDHIRVALLVPLCVGVGALLDSVFGAHHVGEERLLVDVHIHFLDENAVGRDAVALVKEDDVANDEIFAVDGLGGSVLATKNSDLFVLDLILEAQELLLFTPVAECLDHGGKEDGEVDGDGFEPLLAVGSVIALGEDADDEGDSGEDEEDLDVPFVELVPKNLPESAN